MSLDRGTYGSPLLWFSAIHGSTPFGVAGKPGRGLRAPGERQLGESRDSPNSLTFSFVGKWRVPLPSNVQEPFEVFVNGVPQDRGDDYEVRGRELLFDKPLDKEGRLGALRWLSIFLGVAGTYRKNDSVDVVFEAGGRRTVAANLPIVPPRARETGPGP
jgi:hypothetical protein